MPVDRKLFTQHLTKEDAPRWICPTCSAGHLRLLPETLHKSYSGDTEQVRGEEWFGAEHVVYRFAGIVKCDNRQCSESATVSGEGKVREYPDERMENIEYEDIFYPTYVNPSPRLIALPSRCPPEVAEQMNNAFVASWGDFSAAANHVRAATELLLDALRVRKTTTMRGKRKRIWLPLHSRIDSIKAKYPGPHESLLAIKWLGNAGSHPGSLSREAVFDAFDIFESVIDELYSDHRRAVKKLILEVNRRRGPKLRI